MGTSNIADKVVVITRFSSGIGGSTAELLARHTISAREVYQKQQCKWNMFCLGISQSEFDSGRLPLGLRNRTEGISRLSTPAEAI